MSNRFVGMIEKSERTAIPAGGADTKKRCEQIHSNRSKGTPRARYTAPDIWLLNKDVST